jgi:hypothetical protein
MGCSLAWILGALMGMAVELAVLADHRLTD